MVRTKKSVLKNTIIVSTIVSVFFVGYFLGNINYDLNPRAKESNYTVELKREDIIGNVTVKLDYTPPLEEDGHVWIDITGLNVNTTYLISKVMFGELNKSIDGYSVEFTNRTSFYIAMNADMNTVYGAIFAHSGETPGLGAEIVTPAFQEVFKGKSLFNDKGEFVSLVVAKAGEIAPVEHRVDAISGGTITSKGLQEMLYDDLSSYVEFFNQKK